MQTTKVFITVLFAVISFFFFGVLSYAATISGTVYQSDGVTPITGEWVYINAYTGDPCGSYQSVGFASINSSDGTYSINGLRPGTYYLRTYVSGTTNYVPEWWAEGAGSYDCSGAQPVVVSSSGEELTGKNFQLYAGASISGTVYESDGVTPITGEWVYINAYTGDSCGSNQYAGSASFNSSNGTYTINALPPGTYYLRAYVSGTTNYLPEWWAESASSYDCSGAQPVVVSSYGEVLTGKDFQLDEGASISGTVYESDGVTPITGRMNVSAYTGDPCGSHQYAGSASINSSDGTYTINGLPPGTYYLGVYVSATTNYVLEWWAASASSYDCSGAQPVVVSSYGEVLTGKDFQLDEGASISGTVYESDGVTPITGGVNVYAQMGDPCGSYQSVGFASINSSDGTYTINWLPRGTYYLGAYVSGTTNYVSEWWAASASSYDCSGAQPVVVSSYGEVLTGKDFQLDEGASISGTVYESDGVTPITGGGYVNAYTGDPCVSHQYAFFASINSSDGTYTINNLPPGTYYLRAGSSDNVPEWWAASASSYDCSGAQPVVVSSYGEVLTGKDFQLDEGASISGTVYKSDGVTPITGGGGVTAYTGDPCGSTQYAGWASINFSNGTYTINWLRPGAYYLTAGSSDFGPEWWASPVSAFNCSGAQAVQISSAGQAVTGKNFQLDLRGSISGQVIGDVGPIEGMFVMAYSGRCWSGYLGYAISDENGNYLIERLPPIPIYVVARAEFTHLNYVTEWQNNAIDCQSATPVTVVSGENQPNADFTLTRGPKRMRSHEVLISTGNLYPFFMVEPAFRVELVSATVTMPNTARGTGGVYTFDLSADKILYSSECRYLNGWQKNFGPVDPVDYGTYTFTLQFQDGAQETYTYTIQDVPITAVSDISVTVNDDGSVRVTWNRNTTLDHYYEVRVRDLSGGTEIFRSQPYKNYQELNIPASSLSCLEIGKTYRWLVRVYDNIYPLYSKSATQYVVLPYSPGNFTNRYAYASALKRPGGLLLEFSTRSGSRKNVKSIVVTGPNGFNYSFDLLNDWYDWSTETRLSLKGWYKQDIAWPVTDGTYTFNVQYDDDLDGDTDQTEVITRQLTVNTMNLFSADTLGALIYADGAMGFSWGLTGIPGLRYQVRIRSLDGTEDEYYSSYSFIDGTSLTANFADLRAMKRGEMYKWFVRAFSADGDTMEQSAIQQFYYDPAPVYDATKATFNANSAAITYPYTFSRVGDKLIYTGTGTFAGFGRYIEAIATEQVEGVNCLKFVVKGAGHNPDPELDPEWYHLWLAQDTQGNVWVLQAYDGQNAMIVFSGLGQAAMWMPVSPVAGQAFRQIGNQYTQVQKTGVGVTLGTSLGPYQNCLKLIQIRLGNLDAMYLAPGVGIVKEEWNDGGTNNGWELQQIIRAGAFKDELMLNFGAAYGLYQYDQSGGYKQWNTVNPSQMVTVDLNGDGTDELVAAFPGYGLYTYDSTNGWQLINTLIPEFMGAGRNNRIACDYGAAYGLWLWDLAGGWRQINTAEPDKMIAADIDGDGEDELIAGFSGYGLYYYDVPGVWTKINALIPDAMVPYSNGVVCDFGAANGLWSYSKSGGWSQLNAADPDKVVAVDIDNDSQDELVVSFVGYGLYTYEPVGSIWVQINTVIPENMIRQGNGIAVDFGATHGLWYWDASGGWVQRNTVDPGQMTVVDLDNDGVEELVVSFSGFGLYYFDETIGWQLLNTVTPVGMKAINFYP